MFGTAGPRCEHVFRELYENAPYMDLRFLRLKVVELLMLLSRFRRRKERTCTVLPNRPNWHTISGITF